MDIFGWEMIISLSNFLGERHSANHVLPYAEAFENIILRAKNKVFYKLGRNHVLVI